MAEDSPYICTRSTPHISPEVRQTLSTISVILGVCSPIAPFVFILSSIDPRTALYGGDLALLLVLAGFGLAHAARKRGEVGRVATTALWWNKLLLIVYGAMLLVMSACVMASLPLGA